MIVKEKGIKNRIFSVFLGFFLVILILLICNIILKGTEDRILIILGMLLIGTVVYLISKGLKKKIDNIGNKRFRLLMLFLFLLFLGLLMTAGYLMSQVLVMDLAVVYESLPDLLDNMIMDNYSSYYVICNNNVGMMLLLGGYFKFISVFGIVPMTDSGLIAAIFFNAFMIALSVLFVVLTASKLYGDKSSIFIVFLLCFFCPVFYIWTPIFYSDTLSMPFLAATVYIYILSRNGKTYLKRLLLLLLAVFIAFLGFAVKGSVAVVIVAMVIGLFFERKDDVVKTIAAGMTIIVSFSLCYFTYKTWQRRSGLIDFSKEDSISLPFGLWFLYGSHTPGSYSEEDLQYCISFYGLEARKEAVNEKIQEIYASYTFVEYISMITDKAIITWGDGKFGADAFLCTPLKVNFTHHIILEGQLLFRPYTIYANGYHLMNLFLLCFGLMRGIVRNSKTDMNVIYLLLFGTMLFFSFWETTSRYLINIVPLLLLSSGNEIIAIAKTKQRK